MVVYPKLKCKPIDQCEPGELIRLQLSDGGNWAFIATNYENNMISVVLPILPNGRPYYSLLPDDTRYVLSYGKDWNILINQDDANVSLETDPFCGYKGMLILHGDLYLLVMHLHNFAGRTFYVDLISWKMVGPPKHGFAVFLNWSLEINIGGDRFQTLVSFPMESEE